MVLFLLTNKLVEIVFEEDDVVESKVVSEALDLLKSIYDQVILVVYVSYCNHLCNYQQDSLTVFILVVILHDLIIRIVFVYGFEIGVIMVSYFEDN